MEKIIELVTIITPKTQCEKVIEILNKYDADLQIVTLGKGTAGSTLADYFDVAEPDKKVFFALIKTENTLPLMSELDRTLNTSKNKSIIFSLPLKSAMYSVLEQMGLAKQLPKHPTLSTKIKRLGEKIKSKRKLKTKNQS